MKKIDWKDVTKFAKILTLAFIIAITGCLTFTSCEDFNSDDSIYKDYRYKVLQKIQVEECDTIKITTRVCINENWGIHTEFYTYCYIEDAKPTKCDQYQKGDSIAMKLNENLDLIQEIKDYDCGK